ncbi:hypothetical protein Sjap_024888 [Stephania japonica]|uniref:RING-type E3 ubiquitin transferase n=1 Tax=Stephania japonica TaxID=461633 RepID=A0AAP0HPE6_9MAGN
MVKFCVERDEEESEEGASSGAPKRKKLKIGEGNLRDGVENNNGISVILSDPEVLDCTICIEPLFPPVFQCENGHIACSSCCTKLSNKCPFCSWPIGYNRCLAIEKVIESIKVSCRHAPYGCDATFNYNQKTTHEETCSCAPCTCPIADCAFHGSPKQLSLHFSEKHLISIRLFRYNCPFSVCFDRSEPFLVFQGEDGLLFLLNNKKEHIGNSVTLSSIWTSSSNGEFMYDLVSTRGRSSLKFQSFTKCIKRQQEASSFTNFLLVPRHFDCTAKLKLEVCIRQSK